LSEVGQSRSNAAWCSSNPRLAQRDKMPPAQQRTYHTHCIGWLLLSRARRYSGRGAGRGAGCGLAVSAGKGQRRPGRGAVAMAACCSAVRRYGGVYGA